MRQIGTTKDVNLAEKFADVLRAEGIACSVDQDAQGFRIWVQDDDKVPAAKEEFERFLSDPNHERFQDADIRAAARLREDLQRQRASRGKVIRMADRWDRPAAQNCPLTFVLIAVSIAVAVFTRLDPQPGADARIDLLWVSTNGTFDAIRNGEFWRSITPIFLHFGPLHLLFNLFWMRDLGFLIESRVGTFKYLLMTLVIACLSNLFQFMFSGPWFGGLSGLIYGLFGYIWIRGRFEPNTGFDLQSQAVFSMLLWFFLCLFEIIPHVANWAHGVGLVTGMVIAAGGSMLRSFLRRR